MSSHPRHPPCPPAPTCNDHCGRQRACENPERCARKTRKKKDKCESAASILSSSVRAQSCCRAHRPAQTVKEFDKRKRKDAARRRKGTKAERQPCCTGHGHRGRLRPERRCCGGCDNWCTCACCGRGCLECLKRFFCCMCCECDCDCCLPSGACGCCGCLHCCRERCCRRPCCASGCTHDSCDGECGRSGCCVIL